MDQILFLDAAGCRQDRDAALFGDPPHPGRVRIGALLERERLRTTYGRVLVRLADDAFARNAFEVSLEHALALLAHDSCREDAHRLVMRCHVRLGERSRAMRYYKTAQEILRVELDAEPEPATTALFEQIRLNPGAV